MGIVLNVLIIITLIVIAIYDLKTLTIPNFLNIALYGFCFYYKFNQHNNVEEIIRSSAYFSFPLLILYGYVSDFIKKDAIGFGDIKLTFSVGAFFCDYEPQWLMIYFFFLIAFVSGAIVSLVCVFFLKFDKKIVPFSPFLILSFLVLLGWVNGKA